jgi:hypothetical protein
MITDPRVAPHCILCGDLPVLRGIFTPTDSVLYGGNAVQQRHLAYGLCAVHSVRPDTDAIQARLLQMVRQARASWN